MANPITGFLNRIFNPNHDDPSYYNPAVDNLLGISTENGGRSQFDVALQTNVQEAEKNRLFQQQMVQEEREYNTPMAQMARARAAGLNPNLLYGQPISEAGTAPAGSEASVGMGSIGSFAQTLGVGRDFATLGAQTDLMRAQAEEIRSRIPVNKQKINESIARIGDIQASILEREERVRLMISERGLTDAQKDNISFEQNLKNGYLTMDLEKLGIFKAKTAAEISKMQTEQRAILARAQVTERELYEMVNTFAIRRAGLEKQNLLTDAQINAANATAEKLRKEGVRIDQIVNMDSNRETTKQAIYDMAHSSNPLESFGGCLLMSVDYATDGVLGKLLK